MLLLCKKCAYPNLPTSDTCSRCGNMIQSPEKLTKSIQAWDGLPEQVRVEFEQKYREAQVQSKKYASYEKKNHIRYIIVGGLILMIIGFFSGFSVVDIIIGCIAGWQLYNKEGGAYRGLIFFGSGYVISLIIKTIMGVSYIYYLLGQLKGGGSSYDMGVVPIMLFTCGGLIFSLCAGYALGQKMANEHLDRGL